jgi:hypothetical protein
VFGDSHSTPDVCVAPNESFWGLTANKLNVNTVINCSRPAISFDSVCHMLVGEQQRYNFKEDFFIIGLPPLERITIFDNYKDTALTSSIFDTKSWQAVTDKVASQRPAPLGVSNVKVKSLHAIFGLFVHVFTKFLDSVDSWVQSKACKMPFLL